jgi:hypothetical protein
MLQINRGKFQMIEHFLSPKISQKNDLFRVFLKHILRTKCSRNAFNE